MIPRRMGGELYSVTLRVSFLYNLILTLPNLFDRRTDEVRIAVTVNPAHALWETLLTSGL